MRTLFIIPLVLMSLVSLPSWGDQLLLKCESQKWFDDDWFGSVKFVKVDFDTSQVLMKEPADKTLDGWVIHKLTSTTDDYLTIRPCREISCKGDQDFFTQIDRVTGKMKHKGSSRLSGNNGGSFITMSEWQCQKTEKLF